MLIIPKVTLANFKIEKLPLTAVTSNFQGLFVNKSGSNEVNLKEKLYL